MTQLLSRRLNYACGKLGDRFGNYSYPFDCEVQRLAEAGHLTALQVLLITCHTIRLGLPLKTQLQFEILPILD